MKPRDYLIAALAICLSLSSGIIWFQRRAVRRAEIAAANARAEADTSRRRMAGQLQITERLAYQRTVDLAAALKREGQKDQALVRLRIDSLTFRAHVAAAFSQDSTPTDSLPGSSIRAVLNARDSLGLWIKTTTTIKGMVPVVQEPRVWTQWEIHREALDLDVSLSCRGADAVTQVAGPRWANLSIVQTTQSPDICNPAPRWNPFSIEVPSVPVAAGLLVAGALVGRALFR